MHGYQLEISFFHKVDPRHDTSSIDLFQVLGHHISAIYSPGVKTARGRRTAWRNSNVATILLTLNFINRRNTFGFPQLLMLSYNQFSELMKKMNCCKLIGQSEIFSALIAECSQRNHIRRRKVLSIYRHSCRRWGGMKRVTFLLYSLHYKHPAVCNVKTNCLWIIKLPIFYYNDWKRTVYKYRICDLRFLSHKCVSTVTSFLYSQSAALNVRVWWCCLSHNIWNGVLRCDKILTSQVKNGHLYL